MNSPVDFALNFLKQPYPTMGMESSSNIARTGGAIVQEGGNGVGRTGSTMWARIASGLSLDWSLGGLTGATAKQVNPAVTAVSNKVREGAQAVEGKVKSTIAPILTYSKWILVFLGIGIVAYFLGQVRTFIPGKN